MSLDSVHFPAQISLAEIPVLQTDIDTRIRKPVANIDNIGILLYFFLQRKNSVARSFNPDLNRVGQPYIADLLPAELGLFDQLTLFVIIDPVSQVTVLP